MPYRAKTIYYVEMNLTSLQQEIKTLPETQQDQIAAFLTALRMKRDGTLEEIQQRLNDKNPSNWISWDDIKSDFDFEEPK